jgi:hypothetical protein
MPLFMDVHNIEGGVSAADVAGAHKADLEAQGAHSVCYQRYWVDEQAGRSSAWSSRPTPRPPTRSTVRRTVSSPTRSTWSANTPRPPR